MPLLQCGLHHHLLGHRILVLAGHAHGGGKYLYGYLLDIYTILDIIYFLQVGYLHGLAFVSVYSVVSGTAQRWFPPHRRGLVAAVVARYAPQIFFVIT